jgi:hypothetical protein
MGNGGDRRMECESAAVRGRRNAESLAGECVEAPEMAAPAFPVMQTTFPSVMPLNVQSARFFAHSNHDRTLGSSPNETFRSVLPIQVDQSVLSLRQLGGSGLVVQWETDSLNLVFNSSL